MAWGAGEGVRCNPGRKDTELESAQQPGLGFTQRSFAYGLSVSTTETQAGMWGSRMRRKSQFSGKRPWASETWTPRGGVNQAEQ